MPKIHRAVRESGKQLIVGFNRRYAAYYLKLKRAWRGAAVRRRFNAASIRPLFQGVLDGRDPSIGGATLGEACHFVDLMYWLLESEPLSVSAYSLPTDRKTPVGQNIIAASFRFADGSVGNLTYCTISSSKTSGGERAEVFAEGVGAFTSDFKSCESELGQRRHVVPQLSRPAEDLGIAVQILSGPGFAECRCQRFRRALELLWQRMLERSSSASHIYEDSGGRMCCLLHALYAEVKLTRSLDGRNRLTCCHGLRRVKNEGVPSANGATRIKPSSEEMRSEVQPHLQQLTRTRGICRGDIKHWTRRSPVYIVLSQQYSCFALAPCQPR
jgi:hypothetical protein